MIKNLLLIFISILVLSFSLKEFAMMFISIPTFMIMSYNVSDSILNTTKSNGDKKLIKNFELIMLIGVVSLIFFVRDFEYTIGGYRMFWELSFLSILFCGTFIYLLRINYNLNHTSKFNNLLSICIFWFFIVPSSGMFLNKFVGINQEIKEIKLIKSKEIIKSTRGNRLNYYIYVKTEFDDEERLEITKELYESKTKNVELSLKKGILGYNYVTKINGK